jgi:hypothetical protein
MRGDVLVLRSTVSAPPGARVDGRLPSGEGIRLKVLVVRRTSLPDAADAFHLEGRLLDATRAARDELATLV